MRKVSIFIEHFDFERPHLKFKVQTTNLLV